MHVYQQLWLSCIVVRPRTNKVNLLFYTAQKEGILDKERAYYKNKYGDPNAIKFEIVLF